MANFSQPFIYFSIFSGKLSAWMNMSTLLSFGKNIVEGDYEDQAGIRKFVINSAQELLVIVLRPNFSNTINLQLVTFEGNSTVRNKTTVSKKKSMIYLYLFIYERYS